jgi:uncharacterized membrane protein YfcA
MELADILPFLVLVLCGVGVGTLSGMFGIGGGTMIIPLLRLGFGVPVVSCTATSLFTMVPTSISGAFTHIRRRTPVLKVGSVIGLGGLVCAPLGVLLGQYAPPVVTICGVVAVITYSALNMLAKRRGERDGQGGSASGQPVTGIHAERNAVRGMRLFHYLLLGGIAGVAAGFLGVGGGFLIVPVLSRLFGFDMKHATPASLVAISLIALPTTIINLVLGNVWILQGLALILGTVPGARLGAWLATRLSDRHLRYGFACLLLLSGVLLFVNELLLI